MGGPSSPNSERLYEGDASGLHVTAMNAGDYDGDSSYECLIGMSNSTLEENHLYFSSDPHSTNLFDRSVATYPPECFIEALAAGDFSPSIPEPRSGPKPRPKDVIMAIPPPSPKPDTERVPDAFVLRHGSPNPFNPITTIAFGVPHESSVSIVIHDVAGRIVRRLVDETRAPGWHSVVWDGSDDEGRGVATGIYFCKMEAPDFTEVKKLTLLK